MRITASQLRADVYRLLDQVLETGEAIEIERRGRVVRIVPEDSGNWLDRLVPREGVVSGDPDDLVHVDWSSQWRPPET